MVRDLIAQAIPLRLMLDSELSRERIGEVGWTTWTRRRRSGRRFFYTCGAPLYDCITYVVDASNEKIGVLHGGHLPCLLAYLPVYVSDKFFIPPVVNRSGPVSLSLASRVRVTPAVMK